MKRRFLFVLSSIWLGSRLWAAVGCDLNDPDRDVKRLFPGSTGYKTLYVSIQKSGGTALLQDVEKRLGDSFHGLYETMDVPYTMYEIYKGEELIGYIHGVNQKGQYGGIQVFLALDRQGTVISLYFQKITSKAARLFRGDAFTRQFVGLGLKDFDGYDVVGGKESNPGKISRLQKPDADSENDFRVVLRAVKKNLLLVDVFMINRQVYQTGGKP